MKLLKKKMILDILVIGGIICITLVRLARLGEVELSLCAQFVLVIMGIILLIGGGVYLFRKYRCPWCHRIYPGVFTVWTEECPHCGDKIE
ncbi:MAG: hypothetical protein J6A92_05570 [Lachnospiraceae bacterium]|nr:hypothetical protein [Lachnospiraceae bacterium]